MKDAKGPVMLATDPSLAEATARYWKETQEQQPSADALDRALAARLWKTSADACGLAVLASEADALAFFEQYPDSLLLIRPPYAEPFLDSKKVDWRACMIRDFGEADLYFKTAEDGLPLFLIGRYPYYVCTAPP